MTLRSTPAAVRHSHLLHAKRHRSPVVPRCSRQMVLPAFALLGCLTPALLTTGCDTRDDEAANADTPIDEPPSSDPPADDPPADPAAIDSIVPAVASAGGSTLVHITTSGFSDDFVTLPPAVSFGGVASAAVVALDSVSVTAEVPASPAGNVAVQVIGTAFTAGVDGFAVVPPVAPGEVIVNEVLANPGGLDANRDGVPSNRDDEFVELVNARATPVDLSSYLLGDATGARHTFPNPTTVPAGGALVVFGAGDPAAAAPGFMPPHASGQAQRASSGSLSLNNGGETLTLESPSAAVIDTLILGASAAGVSRNRSPDGMPGAVEDAHTGVPGSVPEAATGGDFSPGVRVDQTVW